MLSPETKKPTPKRGLGRGLASLLPTAFEDELKPASQPTPSPGNISFSKALEEKKTIPLKQEPVAPAVARTPGGSEEKAYFFADLDDLEPNPNQPRRQFEAQALEELSASIRAHGILSPIVVRRKGLNYEIVAGERRWRAARAAGLKKVPVILKEVGEKAQYQLALIENIQRKDLTPVEEAMAYEHLMDTYSWTQEKVAEQVGKERSTVANLLRVLKLPQPVVDLINENKLSLGHAKALLGLQDPHLIREAAKRAVEEGWSVRAIESYVRAPKKEAATSAARPMAVKDPNVKALERRLQTALHMRIQVSGSSTQGTVKIHYDSVAQLNRLADILAT